MQDSPVEVSVSEAKKRCREFLAAVARDSLSAIINHLNDDPCLSDSEDIFVDTNGDLSGSAYLFLEPWLTLPDREAENVISTTKALKEEGRSPEEIVSELNKQGLNPYAEKDVLFVGADDRVLTVDVRRYTGMLFKSFDISNTAQPLLLETYRQRFGDKKYDYVITANAINDNSSLANIYQSPGKCLGEIKLFACCANVAKTGGKILHIIGYSPLPVVFGEEKMCNFLDIFLVKKDDEKLILIKKGRGVVDVKQVESFTENLFEAPVSSRSP